ncbi:msx2-interacting protein isoform X2 [Hippoglossus hippoglossus]|uniref:msx2-interacting protein isoform X2 n=1 Tax=Hippoglossus hippoglossus TaxID=8267 RepID=UPI00148C2A24|nr:msx2-interacting protein isoform X2 [Hippoglossus hippoglossus]
MVRETRHLWVGNLPEHVREEKIVEHFKRYGRVESVKVLRKRGSEGGVAAFVDFVDIKSAQKAHNAVNKMGDRDLRTDYNEPGSVPSAVRGLEDSSPSSSRDVTGFSRATVGPVFGPPVSLHTREGRYERRIDGSETRERAYDHSPYGHHDRSGTFDRQRHYNTEYYRDRSMFAAAGPGSSAVGGSFEATDPHFDSRIREPFTLTNSTRRDLYRDDRGRRVDRTYHHRRSRSSHSSQSRHPSPQRTTGQTPKTPHSPKRAPLSPGRGPRSRSRSRSSSSDSVSSTSSTGSGSDSNSSSSDGSRARSVQSSAAHAPTQSSMGLDSDEPRRSFGIKVQNLPVRSTDTSLKDGLFHEFKKHGKVTSVQIHGASEDRYGLVFFRQQEDQEKALTVSKGKLFFGMLIEVTAWNGPETESENEFRPLDGRIDEFHPKATRTLFIGNLEKTTSYQQLLDIFQRFGEIVSFLLKDIDIKKVNGVPQYAFVQYSDIGSVCKAIKKMDGEYLGSNRLKLGFGKSMPTTCVWLDGLATNITEQYLTRHFCRYGHVVKVVFDRLKGMALVMYNNTDFAQAAVRETKGWKIGGNKIKVDFASQESQMAFYRSMQASGQDIRDFYEIPTERREERRPPYHEFTAERAYYENIRTPGLYPTEEARRDYAARSRERFPELEHYQGEPFDPRYHEDPRDYRDYRDPFEQDIRKYTYIQRERERERERFEADRTRWSPSHPRRPITPTVSPSPSERAPRDSERRVYSQSSERSGSVSSMSPPHFDKSEKTPVEHSSKSDKAEKSSQPDRLASAEKTKRAKRKEKVDKDKAEKVKSRKAKGQSPSNPVPETELEAGFEGGSGRGRGSDQDAHERQKSKGEGDSVSGIQVPTANHDSLKTERSEISKGDNSDMDGKSRLKKHLKSDTGSDGKDLSVDSDRLAARKRRFADSGGKTVHQKRSRHEDEDQSSDLGTSATYLKESDTDKHKESLRKDSRLKVDKSSTQKDAQEDLRGQREKSEGSLDTSESKRHAGHTSSRRFSHEGVAEQGNTREQAHHVAIQFGGQNSDTDKGPKNKEDHVDIDLSQSYRKQMEQNRRLHQQQQQRESDKPHKPDSPQGSEMEDLEHRSLVHEVGKPPEDVTDNFPSHKLKKIDQFDTDLGIKRERVYRSFRQKSEDPEWNHTASPGHHHLSLHPDEDFADPSQKESSRNDEKIHPDVELLFKRTHNTQMNKQNTPILSVEEEQQKRWESRVKQDLIPDLNFSRSLSKNIHNCKRLEYGIWHDLEPGEVRSDSEEDREPKPHSPVPSTSVPFSERPRVDRFSDPKLAQLERNKFYSFALDQTITPDTKALLERAKSLSSSREDNWSFLDYDSHFAGLRNRKDTEKVESAPRPTPSWYMKKKKIRIGSEDKLEDRKEEPKPEEHERRELFASRFLHSPVFELDSRRLQHLERKHEEPEHAQNQQPSQQGIADGELDSGPVVLFHSRFLELTRLQQQKNKTQQQQEAKGDPMVTYKGKVLVQEQQTLQSPETIGSIMEPEIKPISPAEEVISEPRLTPTSVTQSVVKDFPPPEDKCAAINPAPDPYPHVSFIKEEIKENKYVVPIHPPPAETSESEPAPVVSSEPSPSVDRCKLSPFEVKLEFVPEDVKPVVATPCRRSSQDELVISLEPEMDLEMTQPEVPVATSPIPSSYLDEGDVQKVIHSTCKIVSEPEGENKLQVSKVHIPFDSAKNDEPVSPQKEHKTKEKNKKCKQSPAQVIPVPVMSASVSEKQATRKSERIDKEKLKRGSSPRAESRSTGKSPIHGSDPDMLEQSISLGRARRRNVRSVYATPVEDDAPVRSGKEIAESPRSARKRGTDKEAAHQQNIEQDPPAPVPANKRGRPPKNRRHGDDGTTIKVDKPKMDKETDSNESESGERVSKGKTSPHITKGSTNQMSTAFGSGLTRKGDKTEMTEDDDEEMDFTEEDTLAFQDSSSSCKEDPSTKVDQTKEEKEKQGRELGKEKDVTSEGKSNGKETDTSVLEENLTSEKEKIVRGKTKLTRTPRSPVLKNLKIRLNVTEVKDLLQLDELGSQEDSSKFKPGEHSDPVSKCTDAIKGDAHNVVKENDDLDEEVLETPKSLISQELELEQALKNIANPDFPGELQTPAVSQAEVKNPDEEKSATPASETELMAAIYSITPEDTPVTQPPPLRTDVASESEMQDFIHPAKEDETKTTTIQEEPVCQTTPKKGTKGRPKTPKRQKTQKQVRKDIKEGPSVSEELTATVTESIASGVMIVSETTPSAAATVITPTAWKPEPEPSVVKATDVNAESESSSEEQIQHLKSAYPLPKSPICPKPLQLPSECISPSLSPLASKPNIRPMQTSTSSISPTDWLPLSKDAGVSTSPVVTLTSKENPPLPLESENMESEHGTSDLRPKLMKYKNLSLPVSSSFSSDLPSLRDQNQSERNTQSPKVMKYKDLSLPVSSSFSSDLRDQNQSESNTRSPEVMKYKDLSLPVSSSFSSDLRDQNQSESNTRSPEVMKYKDLSLPVSSSFSSDLRDQKQSESNTLSPEVMKYKDLSLPVSSSFSSDRRDQNQSESNTQSPKVMKYKDLSLPVSSSFSSDLRDQKQSESNTRSPEVMKYKDLSLPVSSSFSSDRRDQNQSESNTRSPKVMKYKDLSLPVSSSFSSDRRDQNQSESNTQSPKVMKYKDLSLPVSSSFSSDLPSLRDQNQSESNTPSAIVPNKSPLPDTRMAAHSAPSVVRPPVTLPSPETKSVISVIASTATSVISRVCNPPEPENKVNMSIGNPCVDMTLPKSSYRPSKDDTGSYHGQSVGDEGGSASRFIVESTTLGVGSCPGLRVNTSEGVVVLSHSGQKIEGPQRISAKISQIPQATAGDMESQQLVSMPQIKQEMYGHSQSGHQKGSSLQADHGHPGKTQSALSIKQESCGLEKIESTYQSGPQGVVKRLTPGNQQVLGYHQDYMPLKHQKKMDSADPHSTDGAKPSWTSAISPAISPHLPSPPGNHVGFVSAAGDRAPSHLSGVKQEPRSPRKSGHPHSTFTKVSSPIGSSSPKGIPVMLSTGLPAMQQFITGVHHPEQTVIMPPHSVPGGLGRMSPHCVNQSIPVGHLVQDVRVNTPPLSVMSYGMHSEPLASPWSGPMQPRPASPQAVGREKVLKVNPGSLRSHDGEQEEARHFHMAGRQPSTQLKPETLQSDPRGSLRSGVQLETYMAPREMRVLLHQQGERSAQDPHSGHIQEIPPLSPRPHVLPKSVSEKDITKPLDAKRPHSPLPKDGVMGMRQCGPAMASPQRVQLMQPGPSGSFSEYTGMYPNPRGIHSQLPETSPVNQPPLSVTPNIGTELQAKPDSKMTQPANMVQLLTKYPIVWQGLLALKNDTAAVQLHFVCGNKVLAHRSLPLQEGGALLRIVQRMRLEVSQLESVARRMTGDSEYCLLLALPCGRDQDDVLNQTQALKAAFINYLQTKLAAGIINIPNPGSNQPAYVLQIFPPCEFSESHLSQVAPDLLNRISSISPHLMIVITSV